MFLGCISCIYNTIMYMYIYAHTYMQYNYIYVCIQYDVYIDTYIHK